MSHKRPPMSVTVVPSEEEFVKRIQRTITASELKHLKATPVDVLPAPGTGKSYCVQFLRARYKPQTTPFALNGNSGIVWPTVASNFIFLYLVGLIDGLTEKVEDTGLGLQIANASDLDNQPLRLTVDGASELLNGDGDLIVAVYYTVEPTN